MYSELIEGMILWQEFRVCAVLDEKWWTRSFYHFPIRLSVSDAQEFLLRWPLENMYVYLLIAPAPAAIHKRCSSTPTNGSL